VNPTNDLLLRDKKPPMIYCPSSPLPKVAEVLTSITGHEYPSGMYVGISGADDHRTRRSHTNGAVTGGIHSSGGVIANDTPVGARDITDGLSNTLMFGEQSDWCVDSAGQPVDCRSDCEHSIAMGPDNDTGDRIFNMTVVMHPVGLKLYDAAGVAGNCGPNRPIQSAHSNGANVTLADASVQFLSDSLNMQVFRDLANRDDGHVLGNW
jgi:prepilin-type processing-associated H-X9-DG protein